MASTGAEEAWGKPFDVMIVKAFPQEKLGLVLDTHADGVLRISSLRRGDLAHASGKFDAGDRLLKVNGKPVTSPSTATSLLSATKRVELTLQRLGDDGDSEAADSPAPLRLDPEAWPQCKARGRQKESLDTRLKAMAAERVRALMARSRE